MKLSWTKSDKIHGGLYDGRRKATEWRADGTKLTFSITTMGDTHGRTKRLHSRLGHADWVHDLCRGSLAICQAKAQEIEDRG